MSVIDRLTEEVEELGCEVEKLREENSKFEERISELEEIESNFILEVSLLRGQVELLLAIKENLMNI